MLKCWSLSSELRPSFSNIVLRLEENLQSSQDYLDVSNLSETEFITSSDPFISTNENIPAPEDCGSVVVYQEDQYLQPLAEDKTRARQTTAFPNLSYQTVLFTRQEP